MWQVCKINAAGAESTIWTGNNYMQAHRVLQVRIDTATRGDRYWIQRTPNA